MNLIPIADLVDMLFVKKDNFKTTTVSFNFYLLVHFSINSGVPNIKCPGFTSTQSHFS